LTDGPVIAITADSEAEAEPYADAVRRHGGVPRLVLPGGVPSLEEARELGGMLVSGGADIHPARYGEGPLPGEDAEYFPERDEVELPLLAAALVLDMPVLGICRGMQALNVAMGGGLVRDLPGHSASEVDGEEAAAYHHIYIAPGSKMAAIVGSGGFVRVNSLHHQGVIEAKKSPRLLASAYSVEDGVIEALESPDHDWVIGVQFHPERRMEVPPQFDRLFWGLVDRSRRRS
jgi:putative glutamine amidotransferase